MKSLACKAAIVGAAALTAALSLPAPAFAIDQVTEGCVQGNPHGYVYLANADHTRRYCFANEGKLTGLDIRDITYIDAGNNELTFWVIDSPKYPFEMSINIQKGTVLERDAEEPIFQITAIEIHENVSR